MVAKLSLLANALRDDIETLSAIADRLAIGSRDRNTFEEIVARNRDLLAKVKRKPKTRIPVGLVTADRVRELLNYDPETGVFTWAAQSSTRVKIGAVAGSVDIYGYHIIRVDGRLYRAHRLVWLYVHGEWPVGDIDHINGTRDDNRLRNLRAATRSENNANAPRPSDNTSGVKGVYWREGPKKWMAAIGSGGKQIFIGHFDTIAEAAAARRASATKLFGKYARHE
jgi:hypothetical protein